MCPGCTCVAGEGGACVAGETATTEGGTHPTGMHSFSDAYINQQRFMPDVKNQTAGLWGGF